MTKTVYFNLSSIFTSKKKIIHSYIHFIRKYTNDSCIDLTWGTEAVKILKTNFFLCVSSLREAAKK